MANKKIVYVEPANYIPEKLRKKYKLGEYAEPESDTEKTTATNTDSITKDEIRFKHAVMEYDHEIEYCKKVLASGVTGDARKDAQARLEKAENDKEELLNKKKQ